MNPFVSSAEAEIRAAAITRLRQLWPSARIIHELNVGHGQNRADLAAVTEDQIVLVEIKSERDTLTRLPDQLRAFAPVCHHLIVAAHTRWCGGSKEPNSSVHRLIEFNRAGYLWEYPPEAAWHWGRPIATTMPWAHPLLMLLWTDELRDVATSYSIPVPPRSPGYVLSRDLSQVLTGAQISRAVCRALRQRQFAEADPAIEEAA